MPSSDKETYVYIRKDIKSDNWIPAIQLKVSSTQATVKVPIIKGDGYDIYGCGKKDLKTVKFHSENHIIDLKSYTDSSLPRQNVDASGNIEEYKDMVQLPYLHEAAILYNLKLRHKLEKPYTRTGDIVFAVNPYKWYDTLYTADKRSYYASRIVYDKSNSEDPRATMEPHVYEVSAFSYKGLCTEEHKNQSILVSGESGAGKTETVKICLNHIAQVQAGSSSSSLLTNHNNDNHEVVQRVVDSNPLLEAFGNAQTRRNDNSSRFGKYLQLQFNPRKNHKLVGSVCDVYLLEKSRVVHHDNEGDKERNFHIFYQLLASNKKTKYWNQLANTNNESFKYIGSTKTNTIEGMTDADRFDHTIDSLKLVNIIDDKLHDLMKALCIVLQLGNISFTAKHEGDHDISKVSNMKEIQSLADLMGMNDVNELARCLTERTFKTRDEVHKVPLNVNQAKESCDAFAKEAYERSFLWLVNAINEATSATGNNNDNNNTKKFATIGLLDIFGFESFPMNGYEQLCINYANEKLQQKFNQDIFDNVKAEYEREGIDLAAVEYEDNADVLKLIEGKTGLLALLNEECVRPKGNDFDFVQKALQINNKSKCLIINKTDRLSFGIQHYAGVVMYHGDYFVVKNLDTIPTDLQECMAKAKNMVIRTKIESTVDNIDDSTMSYPSSPRKMNQSDKSKSNISAPTVWTKYKSQLSVLMRNLKATQSRYIRCIKPNDKKKPFLMEHENVVNQLRCSGVVAAITISRNCFANRLPNSVVLARYGFQVESAVYKSKKGGGSTPEETRSKECQALMEHLLKSKEVTKNGKIVKAFVVGKTTTYFRTGALEHLECNRSREHDFQAIVIQRAVRNWYRKALLNKGKERKRQQAAERAAQEKALADKRAKKMKEDEDRRNQRKKKQMELNDILTELENDIAIEDKICSTAIREIEKRTLAVEDSIKELQEREKEIQEQQLRKLMEMKAAQEKKIHQAGMLISMLKKENGKLRRKKEKVKIELDELSERSERMRGLKAEMDEKSNDLMGDKSERKFSSLKEEHDDMRKQNQAVRNKINETTEMYNVTAGARLEYQRAMVKILHMVEDHVKKRKLQEEIVTIAFDAERAANLEKAELEMITGGVGIDHLDVSASQTY